MTEPALGPVDGRAETEATPAQTKAAPAEVKKRRMRGRVTGAAGATAPESGASGPTGFGFLPEESQHHFLVSLPAPSKDANVYVTEHFEWDASEARRELHFAMGREDNKLRVVLPRTKWDALADHLRAEFNQRLRDRGMKPGKWSAGRTPVQRAFGKELVLLCWAIEEADPALIPTAVRNWLGLAPEERWWLFTMTNAATGHAIAGRGKGWRRAVRYALTDNPVAVGGGASDPAVRPGRGDLLNLFAVHEPDRRWGSAPAGDVPTPDSSSKP